MRYFLFLTLALAVGCQSPTPSTQPSAYDRSENALRDPFNYSPNVGKPDISGGGLGEYRPDAMNKDIDHVLNP
jgi:hypothetical protein